MDPLRTRLDLFFRDGDAAAMDDVVRRTRPRLLAAARRIAGAEDAEDAVQSAYHALLRRGAPPESPLFAWLLVAVVRIAYRCKAKRRRERALVDDLGHAPDEPATGASRAERSRLLHREIARLPAKFRDVVVLHHLQELSVARTAALLDVPVSTVTTRLSRARRLLEGRLAPLLAVALLTVPWLCQDALRTACAGLFGVAMSTKQIVLASTVILAVGASGFVFGSRARGAERATTRHGDRLRSAEDTAAVADLRREVARLRGLNEQLRRNPAARAEPEPESEPGSADRAEPERRLFNPIPKKVHRMAAELNVPQDVLFKVWNARGKRAPKTELEALGREGFRALVAILRAGTSSTRWDELFAASWDPALAGEERLLIETVQRGGGWRAGTWTALAALGITGTETARSFLLTQVDQLEDAGHFMSAARALGKLREPRAIPGILRGTRHRRWSPNIRGPALHAMTLIVPAAAADHLIRYLREPGADLLHSALQHLYGIDPSLSQREAAALLDGPRRTGWTKEQLELLRRYAGRAR